MVPAGNVTNVLKVVTNTWPDLPEPTEVETRRRRRPQRRALLPVPNTILGRSLARLHTSVTNMVKMHVTYCGG